MNLTLDQLQAFVLSVKHGSFSAAARKLGKAQSRVSTAIANLEADLGLTLFDRSARLPVLTQQGEAMFVEAQAVLAQCQRLQARALTSVDGEELSLTLAIDEAVPIAIFEPFFMTISERFPLLKLTIINGSQDDIAQWVDNKSADLGILFHLKTLAVNLELVTVGQFNHALVVAKDHPLSEIAVPTFSDLNRYRQLVIHNRVGGLAETAISSQHWYVDSYYHITTLVMRGIGWALIPEHIANDEWTTGKIIELSSKHIPHSLLVEMGIVKRRDKGKGPIMTWMYSEIERMFAEH
jgi:DNA-binding transcriptional LysR family regulator